MEGEGKKRNMRKRRRMRKSRGRAEKRNGRKEEKEKEEVQHWVFVSDRRQCKHVPGVSSHPMLLDH